MSYSRGEVVKGPDLVGPHDHRPYVLISTTDHPFQDEEGLWVTVTTTGRSRAIPLGNDDFHSGGLDKPSFASPWNVATIKFADMGKREGVLKDDVVRQIVTDVGFYIGLNQARSA